MIRHIDIRDYKKNLCFDLNLNNKVKGKLMVYGCDYNNAHVIGNGFIANTRIAYIRNYFVDF